MRPPVRIAAQWTGAWRAWLAGTSRPAGARPALAAASQGSVSAGSAWGMKSLASSGAACAVGRAEFVRSPIASPPTPTSSARSSTLGHRRGDAVSIVVIRGFGSSGSLGGEGGMVNGGRRDSILWRSAHRRPSEPQVLEVFFPLLEAPTIRRYRPTPPGEEVVRAGLSRVSGWDGAQAPASGFGQSPKGLLRLERPPQLGSRASRIGLTRATSPLSMRRSSWAIALLRPFSGSRRARLVTSSTKA